jgi:hypothetical protein
MNEDYPPKDGDVIAVIPRCLTSISEDTVRKIKNILVKQKCDDVDVNEGIDRLLALLDECIKE